MSQIKKFYLILIFSVIILALIFAWQIKKNSNIDVSQNSTPLISAETYNITPAENEIPRGNPGAAITIIEYMDLTCQNCATKYQEVTKLIDENPTKVRLFLRIANTSGLFSHDSKYVHIAAYCASQQNHYWKFLDTLMNKENRWSEDTIIAAAQEAQLNIIDWNNCRESDVTVGNALLTIQAARDMGITKSPTIFINNKKIDPETKVSISKIIKELID